MLQEKKGSIINNRASQDTVVQEKDTNHTLTSKTLLAGLPAGLADSVFLGLWQALMRNEVMEKQSKIVNSSCKNVLLIKKTILLLCP